MQLKVGDKVRFLNEVGQGTIVGIIDSRTVMVQTAEGFDIPTLVEELILDTPITLYGRSADRSASVSSPSAGVRRGSSSSESAKAEVVEPERKGEKASVHLPLLAPSDGVQRLFLGFVPEDEHDAIAGPFRLYAINEGLHHMMLTLCRWEGSRLQTFFAAKLRPNTARYVGTILARDLFLYATIRLQALYFSDRAIDPVLPESVDVELKLSRFTRPGAFQVNRYLGWPMLCAAALSPSPLESQPAAEEQDMPRIAGGKVEVGIQSEAAQPEEGGHAQRQEVILNLQMDVLSPRQSSLSVEEQLAFQMQHFARGMEQALGNGVTQRLVVIHGLGNSKLRRSVISALRSDYPQCRHQDASFKEYDYGATLIILPAHSA